MKERRVGSISCGVVLMAFGIVILIHQFIPAVTYEMIISFWPCVLIILGVEILVANIMTSGKENVHFKYDFAAVFIIIALTAFSMGMGIAETAMDYAVQCGYYR